MSNFFKKALLTGMVVAATSMVSTNLLAQQTTSVQVGPNSAAVNLDFRVIIPSFLQFRVGSAGAATIDLIEFDLTGGVPEVGDGTDVNGTGGDAGPGQVTASVRSNGGQVTITPTNNSLGLGMDNGATGFIPYSEILTASSDNVNMDAPTLSNAGGTTTQPVLDAVKPSVTDRSVVWTYTYDNSAVYEAGTYGTSANGGRVTYTASTP